MNTTPFDLCVCVGRFQLLHNGQLGVIREGLRRGRQCLVVIGSAFQARSPKNTFTWQEREAMIRMALTNDEVARVTFAPVRDYWDNARWVQAVRAAAAELAGPLDSVAIVGHRKDATSSYLADFPGWPVIDPGRQGAGNAADLRASLYATDNLEAALASIAAAVPSSTIEFLRAWAQQPGMRHLQQDWRETKAEMDRWAGSPYPPVFVTVDAVVRMADHVLLIRRGRAPGRGLLALPGGFLEARETVYQSTVRELKEETGWNPFPSKLRDALREVRVFDHPDRSQRGRVITHAHYFAFGGVPGDLPEVAGSDDATEAMWVPIEQLAELEDQFHDDHFHILDGFGLVARP